MGLLCGRGGVPTPALTWGMVPAGFSTPLEAEEGLYTCSRGAVWLW